MPQSPDNNSNESAAESFSPTIFEKSLIRYLMRRKAVLGVVASLLFGAAGWSLKQYVKVEAGNAVRAQSELIQTERNTWRKNELEAMVELKSATEKAQMMEAEIVRERQKAASVQKEFEEIRNELKRLLPEAQKIPDSLAKAEKLRSELATTKNISDLQGDVNKITERLLNDKDFQKTLTGNVSAEIAEVGVKVGKLEEESRKVMERMNAHDEEVRKLAGHPLIGGVPYRVLHVEKSPAEDYVAVHQASSEKRVVGKVFYDASTERAQFYRLSTSTSHEVDKDDKFPVPRCNVLFKGWLPETSLKLDETKLHEAEPTMIELRKDLALKDQMLREGPGYERRSLAIFDGYHMPFFATGTREAGWIQVTFEGWMAVTNGKGSSDPSFKNYLAPAIP